MKEILPVVGYMSIALVLGIIVTYFRDRNTRRLKDSVLQQLQDNKRVIELNAKITSTTTAPLSFSIQWGNADIIFIENSIIYFKFFYLLLTKLQVYIGGRQFSLKDGEVSRFLPNRAVISLDTVELKKQDLIITSRQGYRFFRVKQKVVLKGIGNSNKLDIIREMLKVT